MKKIFLTTIIGLVLMATPALAQKSISLSTYYPAPTGNYDNIETNSLNASTLQVENATVTGTLTVTGTSSTSNIEAPTIKATSSLEGPNFISNSGRTTVLTPLFTRYVYVGGDGNARLFTRHVQGKESTSTGVDDLFLQYNTNKDVNIGGGAGIVSNLRLFNGNIRIGGYNNELKVDFNSTATTHSSLRWAGLQLGSSGENRIIAGRNGTGGQLAFYVNNTNDATDHTVTPNGIRALLMNSDGNIYMGDNNAERRLDINGGYNGSDLLRLTRRTGTGSVLGRMNFNVHNSDPTLTFDDSDNEWSIGVDDSHNSFVIAKGARVGSDKVLSVSTSNRVGINVESPGFALDVMGPAGTQPAILRSPHGYVRIGAGNDSFIHFYTDRPRYYFDKEVQVNSGNIGSYDEDLSLRTRGATRMTIQHPSGYVGINTLNPQFHLDVNGSTHVRGDLRVSGDIKTDLKLVDDHDVYAHAFYYTSDATLKDNVTPIANALDKVQAINGVTFNWKKDGSKDTGLIAQNVERVLPELVNTNEDGIKSVKYGNMVALLVEAIKEQQTQINALKAEIEMLKK